MPQGAQTPRLSALIIALVMTASAGFAQNPIAPQTTPFPPNFPQPKTISPEEQQKQQDINKASKLARQAETDGDTAKALEYWQFVNDKRPGDYSAYHGIRRDLTALKRFDDALTFLNQIQSLASRGTIPIDPSSVTADRVELLYSAGRAKDAHAEMDRALSANRGLPSIYRELSDVLYAQRRSDDAVELLRRGRRETGQPYLFAREIAQFAEAKMDWNLATNEYLLYLLESPDRLSFITGALGDIMQNPGGDSIVVAGINRTTPGADSTAGLTLTALKAGLLFRAQRYAEALDAYAKLDKLRGGSGADLLDIAGKLTDEGELELALKAYSDLIGGSAPLDVRLRGYVGKARAAEALGWLDTAKVACENALIAGIPPDAFVESNYRLGRIILKGYGPVERARGCFEAAMKLIKQSPNSAGAFAEPVMVQYAVTFEIAGDFDRAKKELEQLVKAISARGIPAAAPRMELARIAFRRGSFEEAKNIANSLLLADPGSAAGNDALELLSLLSGLADDTLAMRGLGQSDMLYIMRQEKESMRLLDSLAGSKSPRVREEALRMCWQRAIDKNDAGEALRRLSGIVDLGDRALRRDWALFETARIYRLTGKGDLAAGTLESLLKEYPDSPLSEQARRLSRSLRGNRL